MKMRNYGVSNYSLLTNKCIEFIHKYIESDLLHANCVFDQRYENRLHFK